MFSHSVIGSSESIHGQTKRTNEGAKREKLDGVEGLDWLGGRRERKGGGDRRMPRSALPALSLTFRSLLFLSLSAFLRPNCPF